MPLDSERSCEIINEYRNTVDESDEDFDEYADQYRTNVPEDEQTEEGLMEHLDQYEKY